MESVFRADLFAGKQVVITGGASGIGLGISQGFIQHGADVLIISRTEERLKAACDALNALGGGTASYRAADVRDADALQAIADDVGGPHVLINAAAGNFPTPFSAMSPNAWESVIDIVLHGTANATRSFGEKMPDGGCILNIVAGYAWTGAPAVSHSGAAKAGVLNLTKSLAVEWAPRIRLNAVSPGPIGGTEGMKRLGEDLGLDEAVVQGTPLRRMGDVGDIADACLFLASPAADYITGTCLVVDGGQDAIGPFGSLFQAMH